MKMRRFMVGLLFTLPALAQDAEALAKDYWWHFPNFVTSELTWEQFRDTFIGVTPSYDTASPADRALFDLLYTGLAERGNCFGMSLLSQMVGQKGGHMGICAPINQYSGDTIGTGSGPEYSGPSDVMLRQAINVMHGYQINLPTLEMTSETLGMTGFKNQDGNWAWNQVLSYKESNDPTLVSITKSLNPADGGHTMVAYDASRDDSTQVYKIWVLDPKRSWSIPSQRQWYRDRKNFISVDSNTAWSFPISDTETWSGGPPGATGGGNILITPISISGVHSPPVTAEPSISLSSIFNMLIFSGEGSITQVTDSKGKRLYVPGGMKVDTDPATGLLNIVPFFPSSTGGAASQVFFVLGNYGGELNVQIKAGSKGCSLNAVGAHNRVSITATGGAKGLETVTLLCPGTEEPTVLIKNSRGVASYDVGFTNTVPPRQESRQFTCAKVKLPKNSVLELGVIQGQSSLIVTSPTSVARFDLSLRARTQTGYQTVDKPGISVQPNYTTRIRPKDWKSLNPSELQDQRFSVRRFQGNR